jgi:hypothetical protein
MQLSDDLHEDIVLWEQDSIREVASRFCAKYSLPAEVLEQIVLEFQRQLADTCGQNLAKQPSGQASKPKEEEKGRKQATDEQAKGQASSQGLPLNRRNPYLESVPSAEDNRKQLVESTPLKEISKWQFTRVR